MKKIEDIESMQPEELESAALGEEIKVPAGLEERILDAIAAKEALRPKSSLRREEALRPKSSLRREASPLRWVPYAALAVAAGLAAVAIIPRRDRLRDTFDDPYLAYAQVEATFQKISDKMAVGVGLAEKAGQTADKPMEIINKIK